MVMELVPLGQQAAPPAEPDALPCSIPAVAGSRLAFSWGVGTQLRLAEVASPSTGAGGEQPYAAICQWGITTGDQRRIAYQIMPLFRALKRRLLALGPGRLHEAKEARRQYSAAVLDVLMADASDPALGPPGSEAALQVAYEAALWQLLELFFLRSDAEDGYFAEAFAAWLAQHGGLFCEPAGFDVLAAEAARLAALPRVELDPSYWDTIHRLVLLGRLEAAAGLLTAHPAYRSLHDPAMAARVKALDAVYTLLRVVPRLARPDGATSLALGGMGLVTDDPVAFGAERAAWQQRVDALLEQRDELLGELSSLDPAAAKGLAVLLRLLAAGSSRPAFADAGARAMASRAHNWVELLAGSLLWQHPMLPQLELKSLVARVTRDPGLATRESDPAFLDFFEQLLLAACGQEVQPIINLCTNHDFSGLQFVVHIYEVLAALPAAARVICRPLPHLGCDQAESFTLHYAEALMGPEATWALAAEYLAWCPVHGRDVVEGLLDESQFPVLSPVEAHRALAIAQRHGLTGAAQDLARRLGMAAAASGQLAAAVQWALRAHDAGLCGELVAPLIAKVQQQLLAQAGSCLAAPLDLPELEDMQPLLLSLPGGAAGAVAAADHADGSGFEFLQQQQPAKQQQYQHQLPYPELQFLAAMLVLQQTLQEVARAQEQQQGGGGAAAALTAAYERVRQPVRALLLDGGGLAPAAVRLPLLLHIAPLLDSEHMSFSRAEVQGLMQALTRASSGLPAEAAAVLQGAHDGSTLAWPQAEAVDAAALSAARLALARGLARAHVGAFAAELV